MCAQWAKIQKKKSEKKPACLKVWNQRFSKTFQMGYEDQWFTIISIVVLVKNCYFIIYVIFEHCDV